MKKKMSEKKKEKFMLRRQLMGYCPFESRYNGLYRDTRLGGWPGCSQGGHDTVGLVRSKACDTATAQPQYG